MLPFSSSVSRHSASLRRIARGSLLRHRRYCQSAPTSCRPSRVVSFPHWRGTTHCCASPGSGELLFAGSSSVLHRCLNPLPATRSRGDGWISQVPWQPLLRTCPALRPRRTECIRPLRALDVAFRALHDVGSAFRPLSRLNHTACSLAVYASQLGLLRQTPRKTRFPLTATPRGTGLSPARLLQEVSTLRFNSHRFLLFKAFLAHEAAGQVRPHVGSCGVGRPPAKDPSHGCRNASRDLRSTEL